MRRSAAAVLLGLAALAGVFGGAPAPAGADDKPEKPRECVAFARRWADAVEEARAMSAPVMVHCLDFEASATWGYQSGVLCNRKYMDTAAANTVDVMGMTNLEKAAARHDKRAQTYEATADGAPVRFLVEFPGLTIDDVVAMTASTSKYDTTGYAPFTAMVDPWTETTIQYWSGGQSAHTIVGAVADARKRLEKEHGKGATRKDAHSALLAKAAVREAVDRGDFSTALKSLALGAAAIDKPSEGLKKLLADVRSSVIAAADKALTALEGEAAANPAAAKPKLAALLPKLAGTGLESRAQALLTKLG